MKSIQSNIKHQSSKHSSIQVVKFVSIQVFNNQVLKYRVYTLITHYKHTLIVYNVKSRDVWYISYESE